MDFRKFYDTSKFEFVKEGKSNWDYYKMVSPDGTQRIVALAKPGTGADDCHYGSVEFFERRLALGRI